ncbi:MAG: hypothetical protein K2Q32_05185 [Alphaproteobacteria bacterium]|nr:hypothetical protein [Alphaproteobacteria bacterium]
MFDNGQVDVLVVLGIDKKDRADFIRRARLKNQLKQMKTAKAAGIQPAIGAAMVMRDDSKICFLKSQDASFDTSTDASAACKWLLESNKNENGWLKSKSSVTAIFISDKLHMPRCIRNLRTAWSIIPEDVRSKIHFTQLAIPRSKTSAFQILSEWFKLGIQRTTGVDRRPKILRRTANIATKLAKG